jgi:hypothetical protein
MSPTQIDRNFRSVSGKSFQAISASRLAELMADALRRDFGDTHRAVKTVCSLTGAHERAVKNWFEAKNGPTGKHLVALMGASDAVLGAALLAAGRRDLVVGMKLAESRRELRSMLSAIHELQNDRMKDYNLDRLSVAAVLSLRQEAHMLDPADVIKIAIHAAFVKYPMEDDPDFNPHWIKPEECAHLAKVIVMELEANGLQIVRKPD